MAPFTIALFILAIALQCILALPAPNPPLPNDFTQYSIVEQMGTIPNQWIEVEPAPIEEVIPLRIGFKLQNLQEFERQFMEISTPGHPNYGKHMTSEQIYAMLDPTDEAVQFVLNWLKTFGIEGIHDHQWIKVDLTVAQADQLLQAQYKVYHNSESGKSITRTLSYSLPSFFLDFIDLVLPATSFAPDPGAFTIPKVSKRQDPPSCETRVTPACLQKLYGIPTSRTKNINGDVNHIGVPGFLNEFANKADLSEFLKQERRYLVPPPSFDEVFINGGRNDQNVPGIEANLDIQYTVGLANGVPTTFYSMGNNDTGFVDFSNYLLGMVNPPSVISISYGYDERDLTSSFANNLCNTYMQLGAKGISVIVASGDGGVAGSRPKDDYQLGSQYAGLFNPNGRGFPDVAAQGENIAIILKGVSELVEGTSASTPIFASVIALLNDELITAKKSKLGFLNPLLYSLSRELNDVSTGSNPSCKTSGFPALRGWDPVTGLGTPNYELMRTALGLS
ncbi:hypothetical protein BGZ65_011778 [Modicella reniformis]|uniref:Peptidase S53 domain-containing protein n=1 Tax=Modicella reniformis TaxID=1440133 RepID=A0A9P6IN40_9FUNG|nr:hypothetical protein BGZ65_011778 [Modicella reniformis]